MTGDDIARDALAVLRPPPRLPLSAWIEQNVYLPQGVSATPGRVRLWPHQRGIADAIGDPSIERVTLVKSARLGFTFLLTGAIGHFACNDPSPILVLQPVESDCRDYVVSDIEPTFDASPALHSLLGADTSEHGRSTLLHRLFAGGSLKVVAAKSPRNLRRHSARILFIDEADACETSAEGSPILLAEKRTLSFPDRKIVIGSTPLNFETSNVLRAYEASDMRLFEVPCPSCGAFSFIEWRHLEWEDRRPETARFRCPHCAELVDERHKLQMLTEGRWRAQRPEVTDHAGFRINALVSPLANAAWPKLVDEFLRAKDDPDLLRPFVNTVLGEAWREAGDEVNDLSLQTRCEAFGFDRIPREVLCVTCGVDVQRDRIEASIVGWSREGVAYVLGHVVLWGQTDGDDVWFELDELLRTRWRHPWGGILRVDATCIDAGDGATMDRVLNFCQPRLARRIWAIKGAAGARPALIATKSKSLKARLFIVGVDSIKSQLFDRLARGRSIRFSESLETVWFEQLTSERRVVRYSRGQPTRRFERIPGRAAEALDCMVYAIAAKAGVTIQWDSREQELKLQSPPPAPPSVYRSQWMNR